MTITLAFVVAAALGTVIRWWTSRWNRFGRPVGTLVVNVVAAFALGLLVGSSHDTGLVAGVAGLGSLSTFSTVVKEVDGEIAAGRTASGATYAAITLGAGVAAASLGIAIG